MVNVSDLTITSGEAAEILGVSERTVRRFADRGVLRAHRLSPTSPRRFHRAEVEALLPTPEV